jgi:hypothetical protein
MTLMKIPKSHELAYIRINSLIFGFPGKKTGKNRASSKKTVSHEAQNLSLGCTKFAKERPTKDEWFCTSCAMLKPWVFA